jgi:glutathionylspermidine synthase
MVPPSVLLVVVMMHQNPALKKMKNSHLLLALCLGSVSAVNADSDQPQQLHIAAASRTSFRVSWKTESTLTSQCSYGSSPTDLTNTAQGKDGYQYIADHGYHHNVLLENIPQDTVYYYQCGDGSGSSDTTSDVIQFNTAPSPDKTVKMAIFGDWGYLDSVQRPMDIPFDGLQMNWTATLLRELLESLKDKGEMDLVHITGKEENQFLSLFLPLFD